MKIDLNKLNYKFKDKPLLIGGKAKEYYDIRKSGADIDFVVSEADYLGLSTKYSKNLKDLYGDLGVTIFEFEIWKTICLFNYDFLSDEAIEKDEYKIISLEKLLFLTSLAIKKEKYLDDLKLIVNKVLELKYKNFDATKYL